DRGEVLSRVGGLGGPDGAAVFRGSDLTTGPGRVTNSPARTADSVQLVGRESWPLLPAGAAVDGRGDGPEIAIRVAGRADRTADRIQAPTLADRPVGPQRRCELPVDEAVT